MACDVSGQDEWYTWMTDCRDKRLGQNPSCTRFDTLPRTEADMIREMVRELAFILAVERVADALGTASGSARIREYSSQERNRGGLASRGSHTVSAEVEIDR